MINEIIRNPTPDNAITLWNFIIPDEVKGIMPDVLNKIDSGENTTQLANATVYKILDVVEERVLNEGVNTVFQSGIADRIMDMMTGQYMVNLFERVANLLVGHA